MATNHLVDRESAAALIPEDVSREIIKAVNEESILLRIARKRPNMSRKQQRLPILATKPEAYFVNGDTGLKQTSDVSWDNIFLNAEPAAVIIPIPDDVAEDADYDLWEQLRPEIVEAFGVLLDAAMLHGINKPASWPTDIQAGATAAGHRVAAGTGADLYDDLLGPGGSIALLEEDGFMATAHVAAMSMRARLRGVRAAGGELIFQPSMQERGQYDLDGAPLICPRNGAIDPSEVLLFSGDWSYLQYAIRADMRFRVFSEGVITDNAGNTVLNLMQQDSRALRVVMRIAFVVPNPPNRLNPNAATRYPFSILTP
jgi:HK97 family phage major capsid protein